MCTTGNHILATGTDIRNYMCHGKDLPGNGNQLFKKNVPYISPQLFQKWFYRDYFTKHTSSILISVNPQGIIHLPSVT